MTHIVASTLSMVRPPWIVFIALEALPRASRVSLLMFAVSMLAIWPSRFMICAEVCSSVCSSCFFFRRAARAAVGGGTCQSSSVFRLQPSRQQSAPQRKRIGTTGHTSLVGVDKLPRFGILLVHLVLQVALSLVQHLKRAAQLQNGLLGSILVLGRCTAKPAA